MTPATMRAVVIERPGSPDVLEIRNVHTPTPRHGEILIKVEALGLLHG
jgi:NADPH:quinone reductase-like Zn-dependent oxidoreductase